jgi:hypothetical protein
VGTALSADWMRPSRSKKTVLERKSFRQEAYRDVRVPAFAEYLDLHMASL